MSTTVTSIGDTGRRRLRAAGSHQHCSLPGGQVPAANRASAAAAGMRP